MYMHECLHLCKQLNKFHICMYTYIFTQKHLDGVQTVIAFDNGMSNAKTKNSLLHQKNIAPSQVFICIYVNIHDILDFFF
jgi:hypothetical protein